MKIHIVQKGDTLWQLAQQYGVEFADLKKMNTHLEDPDHISPGMKVKIPTMPAKAKPTEMPQKVAPKKVAPKKVTPKPKEAPQLDVNMLKDLIKMVPTYQLKQIIYEIKPEFVQEIEIDIDVHQNQHHDQLKQPKVPLKKPLPKMKPIAPPPAPHVVPKKTMVTHCAPFSPYAAKPMMQQNQHPHHQYPQHPQAYHQQGCHPGYNMKPTPYVMPQQGCAMPQPGYGMQQPGMMPQVTKPTSYGYQPGRPDQSLQDKDQSN